MFFFFFYLLPYLLWLHSILSSSLSTPRCLVFHPTGRIAFIFPGARLSSSPQVYHQPRWWFSCVLRRKWLGRFSPLFHRELNDHDGTIGVDVFHAHFLLDLFSSLSLSLLRCIDPMPVEWRVNVVNAVTHSLLGGEKRRYITVWYASSVCVYVWSNETHCVHKMLRKNR